MHIYKHDIVRQELDRLNALIGVNDGREVQVDINILIEALDKIEVDLLNGEKEFAIIYGDMWEECHNALDKIVLSFNLTYSEELSNYNYHKYAIVRRQK